MLVEAIVVAALAAFYLGFEDGKFSLKRTVRIYGMGFAVCSFAMVGVLWLIKPAFVGILGGWYRVAAGPIALFSVVILNALLLSEEKSREYIIQLLKIAFVFAVAIYLLLTPVFYSEDLYNIPKVKVYSNTSQDEVFTPIDTEHIRLVDQKMAYYLANKVIGKTANENKGNTSGVVENLGSQFEVREDDFHIQKVNGHLWWVAPLQFRGFWKWQNAKYSPGFVMVDAENPQAEPQLHLGYKMKYLPSAYWGKELHRYVYQKGYKRIRLEDFTLEVTDDLQPRYVLSLTEPTVLNSGYDVKGILVVNPENGEIKEYSIESVPEWVDRVVPERIARDYLTWYGKYKNGWWNSVLSQRDINVPTSIESEEGGYTTDLWLIYGSNKEPYWYTGMTSPSTTDQSLTSIALVSLKTGKIYQYKISGLNEQAAIDAVNSDVSLYSNWHASVPIPYNIYGQVTYVVPISAQTQRGEIFKEVAFVDISNAHIERDANKAKVLTKYKAYLFSKGKRVEITSVSSRKTINGTVKRIADVSIGGTSSFRVLLNNCDVIFAVDPILMPEIAVTSVGDNVSISYYDTEDAVVAVDSFDNLDVNVRTSRKIKKTVGT